MKGRAGDDVLEGNGDDDVIHPGPGDDFVDGGSNDPVTSSGAHGDLVSYQGDTVDPGAVQFEAYLAPFPQLGGQGHGPGPGTTCLRPRPGDLQNYTLAQRDEAIAWAGGA